MKTFSAKKESINRVWYFVDAKNQILGRFSTQIAKYLKGKHKPEYTPHVDVGDYIIVLNAKKIIVSGNKKNDKFYYHHTGYVGGIKKISFKDMLKKYPERIIKKAVQGMLPKNSLGRSMFKKLKVFREEVHPHVSQKPIFLNFKF